MAQRPAHTIDSDDSPVPTRRIRPGRVIGFMFLFVCIVVFGYAGYLYKSSPSLQKYVLALFGNVVRRKPVADAFDGMQTMNLVIIGRDYDYSDSDQIIKTHARSDMLMVGHFDFTQKRISLLSIPRDTWVPIPGHHSSKINAAHAYGGPVLTEATLKDDFAIPSDKYVALDFDGFVKAIDLMGGVDLTVDKKMDYDDNWGHLHIHLLPGYQHLNGEEAMDFARFRHSDSDLIRVQRQQALLAALKAKLAEPATLAAMPQILDTLDQHVDSDLTTDQKIAIARFAQSVPRDQIEMQTLPSYTRGNYVLTNWQQARPIIAETFSIPIATIAGDDDVLPIHHRHRRHHIEAMAT